MRATSSRRGRGSAEIHTLGSAGSTPASATIFRHDGECDCLACLQRRCIEALTEHSKAQTEEIRKLRHDVMKLGDRLARAIGQRG